jgi:arginase
VAALRIGVVLVPFSTDIGRWGSAKGPEAYVRGGLLELLKARGHHVDEPVTVALANAERTRDTVTNLGKIARRQSDGVAAALGSGADLVMVLGGNCTHAPGTAGGVARALGGCGVAWFDAHGDMNTMATTTSGMWGGMPYAVMLGWDLDDWREAAGLERPVPAESAALIGSSDLDPGEIDALDSHPIAHLTAADISGEDVEDRIRTALAPRSATVPGWYLHMDPDVAGPDAYPGGHTPAPTWPPRDKLLRAVAETVRVVDVRAFNPGHFTPDQDEGGRAMQLGIDTALTIVDQLRGQRQ